MCRQSIYAKKFGVRGWPGVVHHYCTHSPIVHLIVPNHISVVGRRTSSLLRTKQPIRTLDTSCIRSIAFVSVHAVLLSYNVYTKPSYLSPARLVLCGVILYAAWAGSDASGQRKLDMLIQGSMTFWCMLQNTERLREKRKQASKQAATCARSGLAVMVI